VARWQLRTWTKGTGAAVEPVGAEDRPPVRARPGGLAAVPARPGAPRRPTSAARPPAAHRTDGDARRAHALRRLDPETVAGLERLERRLAEEEREG
jgi:hypothetical protein